MNERIKELRKTLGLTMDKFGEALGVGRTAISNIESGNRGVTEQMINSICKTNWGGKRVSENWLRTGEGEMFLTLDLEEEIVSFIGHITNDETSGFKRRLIHVLAGLTEDQWSILEKKIKEVLAENGQEEKKPGFSARLPE